MAALGKRRSADEHEGTLDRWGQLYITDAELAEARQIVERANVTPVWAMCMLDAGLVAPGYEDNALEVVQANRIVQHAKRQREFLAEQKKKEEEQEKEMQERSTAPKEKDLRDPAHKKQKTEEDSDAERSPQALLDKMIKEGNEFWGPVVAAFNGEEDCKASAAAKKQKTGEDSDSECDCSICECDRRGMATASMCQKKMEELNKVGNRGDLAYDPSESVEEDESKPCASEQEISKTHAQEHASGAVKKNVEPLAAGAN